MARRPPRREGGGSWLLYAGIVLGIGSIVWVPLARGAYFIVSATTREMIASGAIILDEPEYRMDLIISGVQGIGIMAAIFATVMVLLARFGRLWPIWILVAGAVPVGVGVAALYLPADPVARLVWMVAVAIGVMNAAHVNRQRIGRPRP